MSNEPVPFAKTEADLAGVKSGTQVNVAADKDKDWSKVPRKCHDIILVAMFVMWWVGMFVIAAVAFKNGEPARLTNGVDYQGTTCGTGKMKNAPNIVYPRTSTDLASQAGTSVTNLKFFGVCVPNCPTSGDFICKYDTKVKSMSSELDAKGIDAGGVPKAGFSNTDKTLLNKGPCWYIGLDTEDLFNYCTPTPEYEAEETKYCAKPGTMNKEFFNFRFAKKVNACAKPNDAGPECCDAGTATPCGADAQCKDGTLMPKCAGANEVEEKLTYYDDPATNGIVYYDGPNPDGKYFPNKNCNIVVVKKNTITAKMGGDNPLEDKAASFRRMMARWAGDVDTTWGFIVLFGLIYAFILAFVILLALSRFVKCIVWVVVNSVLVMCVILSFFLAHKGGMIGNTYMANLSATMAKQVASTGLATADQVLSEDMRKTYEYAAWCMIAFTLVVFVIICFFRKKINIACGVMQEASLALQKMPLITVWPFFPYIAQVGIFAWTAYVAAYIASAGEIKGSDLLGDSEALKEYTPSDATQVMAMYHFFGYLWTDQLIKAISMCTVAGSVSVYYFARDKTSNPAFAKGGFASLKTSLWHCLRYSFGSLILGALIIAIVKFLRYCLMYLNEHTKDLQKKDMLLRLVMKCVAFCLMCLEKCLKFITGTAYVLIAIKGESFCAATKEAFSLLFANIGTIALAQTISAFIMILADIIVTVSAGWFFFLYIDGTEKYKIHGTSPVSQPMIPVMCTLCLAAFISHTFMSTFRLAVDTVLICFCIDKKENKENPNGYFMSAALCKSLGVKKSDVNKGDKTDTSKKPASTKAHVDTSELRKDYK